MSKPASTKDRVVVITGAGGGIGSATAHFFAQTGASLALNDIHKEGVENLGAELQKKYSVPVSTYTQDVSITSQAQEMIQQIGDKWGRIDVLVNNAGITRDAMLHKLTEKDWDDVLRVNLKGPFNLGQASAKWMVQQKKGRIINIASVAWHGNIGQTNYSAAKAGLVGMTRTWAVELSRYNITANAIAPGFVRTPMTEKVPPEIRERFVQKIPLKRMGEPQEIAALIGFLSSDEAGYITGQCIEIDGGLTTGFGS